MSRYKVNDRFVTVEALTRGLVTDSDVGTILRSNMSYPDVVMDDGEKKYFDQDTIVPISSVNPELFRSKDNWAGNRMAPSGKIMPVEELCRITIPERA